MRDVLAMTVLTHVLNELVTSLTLRALRQFPGVALAGGAIRSAVWGHSISDVDLVALNHPLLTDAAASVRLALARHRFGWMDVDPVDQADAHAWHGSPPYQRLADAVAEWHDTASSVFLTWSESDQLVLHASYGLADLTSRVVRPTPSRVDGDMCALNRFVYKGWQHAGITYIHDPVPRVDASWTFPPDLLGTVR